MNFTGKNASNFYSIKNEVHLHYKNKPVYAVDGNNCCLL
jgi:hypothetical protein